MQSGTHVWLRNVSGSGVACMLLAGVLLALGTGLGRALKMILFVRLKSSTPLENDMQQSIKCYGHAVVNNYEWDCYNNKLNRKMNNDLSNSDQYPPFEPAYLEDRMLFGGPPPKLVCVIEMWETLPNEIPGHRCVRDDKRCYMIKRVITTKGNTMITRTQWSSRWKKERNKGGRVRTTWNETKAPPS